LANAHIAQAFFNLSQDNFYLLIYIINRKWLMLLNILCSADSVFCYCQNKFLNYTALAVFVGTKVILKGFPHSFSTVTIQ